MKCVQLFIDTRIPPRSHMAIITIKPCVSSAIYLFCPLYKRADVKQVNWTPFRESIDSLAVFVACKNNFILMFIFNFVTYNWETKFFLYFWKNLVLKILLLNFSRIFQLFLKLIEINNGSLFPAFILYLFVY